MVMWVWRSSGAKGALAMVSVVVTFCCIPGGAFGLSKGRAYEMVSPVFKGGYGANGILAVAPDGESVVFQSLGAFAGSLSDDPTANYYISHRGGSGWATTPLLAPAALSPEAALVTDFSATLESSLSGAMLGPNHGRAESGTTGTEYEFLLHDLNQPDAMDSFETVAGTVFKAIGGGYHYLGGSPDFSNIVFDDTGQPGPLLPEAKRSGAIYDLETQSLGGVSQLELVALNTAGKMMDP